MDRTNVYHNDEVYGVLRDAGIQPIRSSGNGHRVKGGYPPNSHDCMPCELVNDRLKENVQQQIAEKSKRMSSLHNLIIKNVKNWPKDFVRGVEKQGGRTK
jgi:hypothetical protein